MYSWNLDSVGNWKSTTAVDYDGVETTQRRVHNRLHQLVEAGGGDYYHDPNGNMIETPSQWLTFDALNRLTFVELKGRNLDVEFRYDAQGRRIRKTVTNEAATKTDYIYSSIQCVEEREATADTMTKQYVWGHYVDELLQTKSADGSRYYPLQDLLYRTNALTDGNGNVVEEYDIDAYGNTLFTPADGETETPTCEFIFTGRRLDPETGLYYYRARYYNPELGRFISKDPLDYVDGMGLYEYVGSNPLTGFDPVGLEKQYEYWRGTPQGRMVNKCTIVIEFGHASTLRAQKKLRANKAELSARGAVGCFADIINTDSVKLLDGQQGPKVFKEFRKNHYYIEYYEKQKIYFRNGKRHPVGHVIANGFANDVIKNFPRIRGPIGGGEPTAWDNWSIEAYRLIF